MISQPFAHLQADSGAVLHMVATLHALAGVVQEQREVKQVGQVDVLQNMGVVRERALSASQT